MVRQYFRGIRKSTKSTSILTRILEAKVKMKKTVVLLLLILSLTWNWATADNLISQDFESVWDLNTPPTGWTILDLGSEGQQNWFTQDWFKYYFSQWGDTVFAIKVNYQKIENAYDEWLITPDIVLPGEATACSLTFDTYYFDGSSLPTGDSAFTMVSADGGAHWTTLMTYGSNLGSTSVPWYENIDVSSYIGQTIRFAFNLKTHGTTSHSAANTWIIDDIAVWADASVLLSHDANGWGPWGDNPPAGWTIYDYGNPIPAQGSPRDRRTTTTGINITITVGVPMRLVLTGLITTSNGKTNG
jgi:hypothetical protein